MKLFAVSDLHLPGNQDKPMDVFGGDWAGHFDKIAEDWKGKVSAEDAVLIAGDISWAMLLSDALTDLVKMKGLPGKKIFTRGNHDYWWAGITALRRSAPDESFVRRRFLFSLQAQPLLHRQYGAGTQHQRHRRVAPG